MSVKKMDGRAVQIKFTQAQLDWLESSGEKIAATVRALVNKAMKKEQAEFPSLSNEQISSRLDATKKSCDSGEEKFYTESDLLTLIKKLKSPKIGE